MTIEPQPFSCVNDENIRHLAGFFKVREDRPWITVLVASYLRPDLALELISALPAGLQARVAVEALNRPKVTEEDVAAIDSQISMYLGKGWRVPGQPA